jgi:RNA polymerase sigma-70 factor, ECF subfamily
MIRDEEFYKTIIRPIEETMMACIWRVTQNRENAQDAMQEALVTIWRKRRRILAHPKPEALVLRICRDKAIDGLRKAIRRSRWELPTAVPDEAWPAPADSTSPEANLHRQEIMAHIRRIIASLPRKQAQAVLMHLVEEQPYADVAATLGCSEATIRSHVRRGRDRLQSELQTLRGGKQI